MKAERNRYPSINYKNYCYLYKFAAEASDEAQKALLDTLELQAQDPTQLESFTDAIQAQMSFNSARQTEAMAAVNVLESAYAVSNSAGMALRFLFQNKMSIPTIQQLQAAAATKKLLSTPTLPDDS